MTNTEHDTTAELLAEIAEREAEGWIFGPDLVAFTDQYSNFAEKCVLDRDIERLQQEYRDAIDSANESAVAEHMTYLKSWRRSAMRRLRRLVGKQDARVLAIEAARIAGQDNCADRILRRELRDVEASR